MGRQPSKLTRVGFDSLYPLQCSTFGAPPWIRRPFFVVRLAITDQAKTMTELEEAIQDLELEAAEDLALDDLGDE